MSRREERLSLSAENAARMARIATISPPPPGYLESLPMRVLERLERDRRVRRRRRIGAGLSAALLLAGVWMFGTLLNGGENGGEAQLAESAPAHAAGMSSEQVSRLPATASPRLLESGEKESGGKERALTHAESVSAPPRALEGAVVTGMERASPAAAELNGPAPLEWPSDPPAAAERLVALLERRQASYVPGRRSMLWTRGANGSSFAPFKTVASPTDEVRLPQLNI